MIRKIIHIDEEKCNGCGICATACHEGAIDIVNGKAKLVRENFCDGFGDCLPGCPTGAITFEEREAPEYDEAAVKRAQEEKKMDKTKMDGMKMKDMEMKMKEMREHGMSLTGMRMEHMQGGGCPGSRVMEFHREETPAAEAVPTGVCRPSSRLNQWPCQIKLLPTKAGFFEGAKLLIAADCTAYAYANMHEDFMKGKITVIGCPKLDAVDYSEKLTEIIRNNDIKSVTIVRMEVPCCGGLQRAAETALQNSGKFIPWQVVTISTDGQILD
ncbi:MAG: 4Fe-4S binding protein [Bacillota bacterium]|nr:4Fe-4S binding protein [Bacillota bacterium]